MPQDACAYYKCAVAPTFPVGSNLKLAWDGTPVDIGDSVQVKCSRSGLFFRHDRDLESVPLLCLPSGYFDLPYTWPSCVDSKWVQ